MLQSTFSIWITCYIHQLTTNGCNFFTFFSIAVLVYHKENISCKSPNLRFYRKECLIHGIFGLRCLHLDCHFLGGYHEAWCEIVKPLRKFWTVEDYRYTSVLTSSCHYSDFHVVLEQLVWVSDLGKKHLHPSYFHVSPRCSVVTNCRTFYCYILGHQRVDIQEKIKRSLWKSPRY